MREAQKSHERTLRCCSRYGGQLHTADPHKKSTGQMGFASEQTTTNPNETAEGRSRIAEHGAQTAENIRYGQTISETGGMGGMTNSTDGTAEQSGYGGSVGDSTQAVGAAEQRQAQGYGGQEAYGKDQDRNIGA